MLRHIVLGHALVLGLGSAAAAADQDVTFEKRADGLGISIGGKPFAVYVFEDGATTRPFFKDLHAPGGARITRNHPPRPGEDPVDHATMHPGVWMAFSDLNGADSWRNKDRIRHIGFDQEPKGGPGRGEFAVKNHYEKAGKAIAEDLTRFEILVRPQGNLLIWDSTFKPIGEALVFGDQEEMGLGIRTAPHLTARKGGELFNSNGLKTEAHIRGKPADWCAYEGPVGPGGGRVGVLLMTHPEDYPRPWFHVRDYGLLVANPFGRAAFGGPKSEFRVEPSVLLRLRFGIFVYQGTPDYKAAYLDYIKADR